MLVTYKRIHFFYLIHVNIKHFVTYYAFYMIMFLQRKIKTIRSIGYFDFSSANMLKFL